MRDCSERNSLERGKDGQGTLDSCCIASVGDMKRLSWVLLPLPLLVTGCDQRGGGEELPAAADAQPMMVSIEPFVVRDSLPPGWSPFLLAEAISKRLKAAGIAAAVQTAGSGHAPIGLTLRGELTVRNSRAVLRAQLWRRGAASPVWTSTYWREANTMTHTVEAVSIGVTEAVYPVTAGQGMAGRGRNP